MTRQLTVRLPQRELHYDIHIGEGLLQMDLFYKRCRSLGSRFAVISDTTVAPLYAVALKEQLAQQGFAASLHAFPVGEHHKTRQTKEKLEEELLSLGLGRDSCLLALGGGIVTDVTGFVAATYCRGIPFIMLPTSLLAMVDASIGGKTGINVPAGKNMIGAIYQPKAIFMEIPFLKTLPANELKNGLVESIKHGLILDKPYFEFLEKEAEGILSLDYRLLEETIYHSCRIKQQVVEEDEHEMGKRRLLNLGHTIGHAIETLTKHAVAHGQAVAIGILAEAYLSMQLGILSQADFDRIGLIFKRYAIPTTLSTPLSPEDLAKTMKLDKKSLKSVPRFVILAEIGRCLECDQQYCQSVSPELLHQTLEWMCHAVRGH